MIQFELISDTPYTTQGSVTVSDDGLTAFQNMKANFRVVGNTYESLNYSVSVSPTPSFSTGLTIIEAQASLLVSAQSWLSKTYPNIP